MFCLSHLVDPYHYIVAQVFSILARKALREDPELSEKVIKDLAEALGMSKGEVLQRLQEPWGIKRLLMGEWPNRARERRQSEYEARLHTALGFIRYLEHSRMSPGEMVTLLLRLREKAQEYKRDTQGMNGLILR